MVENFHDKTKNSCENLRLIITNSTAISETTVKKIIGILKTGKISTYYGLTEASRSSFMVFDGEVGKYNSVGQPAPDVQIKIEGDDLDGNGEICIKGQNVINNYWKNKEMDGNIENGWLRTSDIGHFDKDGFLYLDGRIDDMINVSGEKVNPSEIEMIVNEIGGIEESIAIGIPHETFGQVVKLFAKKTNESKIQESEVIAYCIKRLERYKVPVNIRFIDEFPRTEYGKIKRYELKDLG
jgi:long-chain acyl-CoA synthetase